MAVQLALAVGLVLAIVLIVFLIVVNYNSVVALQRRCQRAWANIDVALTQRHDQLPNLVAAVRGVMAYEEEVLERVTQARAAYEPDASIHDKAVVSEQTSSAVRSLFATVENYPELKSHQNVMALQEEIERLETLIARRRELFNNQVYLYQTQIHTFPTMWLRPLVGWRDVEMFSASDEERERPVADIYATQADDDSP